MSAVIVLVSTWAAGAVLLWLATRDDEPRLLTDREWWACIALWPLAMTWVGLWLAFEYVLDRIPAPGGEGREP